MSFLTTIWKNPKVSVMFINFFSSWGRSKVESEYDQEIPQLQSTAKPIAQRGRATQQSRDTRNSNLAKQPALSSPSR